MQLRKQSETVDSLTQLKDLIVNGLMNDVVISLRLRFLGQAACYINPFISKGYRNFLQFGLPNSQVYPPWMESR